MWLRYLFLYPTNVHRTYYFIPSTQNICVKLLVIPRYKNKLFTFFKKCAHGGLCYVRCLIRKANILNFIRWRSLVMNKPNDFQMAKRPTIITPKIRGNSLCVRTDHWLDDRGLISGGGRCLRHENENLSYPPPPQLPTQGVPGAVLAGAKWSQRVCDSWS
jgi:hypothetical protein